MLPSTQHLSQLLGSLYDAAASPELWSSFLEQLGKATRASSAGLLVRDADLATVSHSWRMDPELSRLHQDYYYSRDVWWLRGASLPAGSVRTSQSLCPLPELRTTEVYNDCMVHFGLEHGLFAVVENNDLHSGSVSLFRSPSAPEFQTVEVELLNFLAPHLQRAFQIHGRLQDLRCRSLGMESACDLLPTGVILFGAQCEVLFMNRSATASLAEKDGLLVKRNKLLAERPNESALLSKAILEATSRSNGIGFPARTTLPVSRRNRPALQLLIAPLRGGGFETVRANCRGMAFVIDPLQRPRPTTDILRAMFGLTAAECRVALLLGDGLSPREISQRVGISFNTVRSQIKNIFSKTNVKRQGQLVRLLVDYSSII